MLVVIGSRNRSKISGVRRAYSMFFKNVDIVGVSVAAGLPPQPVGLTDVLRGALARASKALEIIADADHAVGVEAGLLNLCGRWFDVHVASVIDRNGWITYGLSPAFEVPEAFVNRILSGEVGELEAAVDAYFKTKDVGEHGGLVSILTEGRVLRDDLVLHATLMALIPRVNKGLYLHTTSPHS